MSTVMAIVSSSSGQSSNHNHLIPSDIAQYQATLSKALQNSGIETAYTISLTPTTHPLHAAADIMAATAMRQLAALFFIWILPATAVSEGGSKDLSRSTSGTPVDCSAQATKAPIFPALDRVFTPENAADFEEFGSATTSPVITAPGTLVGRGTTLTLVPVSPTSSSEIFAGIVEYFSKELTESNMTLGEPLTILAFGPGDPEPLFCGLNANASNTFGRDVRRNEWDFKIGGVKVYPCEAWAIYPLPPNITVLNGTASTISAVDSGYCGASALPPSLTTGLPPLTDFVYNPSNTTSPSSQTSSNTVTSDTTATSNSASDMSSPAPTASIAPTPNVSPTSDGDTQSVPSATSNTTTPAANGSGAQWSSSSSSSSSSLTSTPCSLTYTFTVATGVTTTIVIGNTMGPGETKSATTSTTTIRSSSPSTPADSTKSLDRKQQMSKSSASSESSSSSESSTSTPLDFVWFHSEDKPTGTASPRPEPREGASGGESHKPLPDPTAVSSDGAPAAGATSTGGHAKRTFGPEDSSSLTSVGGPPMNVTPDPKASDSSPRSVDGISSASKVSDVDTSASFVTDADGVVRACARYESLHSRALGRRHVVDSNGPHLTCAGYSTMSAQTTF
ncbi:hypothetical protein Q7P37_006300 [Cladosporium fusiforme]